MKKNVEPRTVMPSCPACRGRIVKDRVTDVPARNSQSLSRSAGCPGSLTLIFTIMDGRQYRCACPVLFFPLFLWPLCIYRTVKMVVVQLRYELQSQYSVLSLIIFILFITRYDLRLLVDSSVIGWDFNLLFHIAWFSKAFCCRWEVLCLWGDR
jgi:hypothetical protein